MKTFYNKVHSVICFAKETRTSVVLIIERVLTICPAKLWKTVFCPRYVSLLKKYRLIVLFTSDVMYKKYKWLAYSSPDLLSKIL